MINTERLCLGCMNDNGGEKVCPICGFNSTEQNPASCLPIKFIINDRYLVGKALKANGESITYIGWDNGNDSVVTIKEYFPKGFAIRNPDKTVSMSDEGKYTFNEGLIEFMEINRKIMHSDLPALVPVTDVFEENGTVYAVSVNIPGITLSNFLKRNGDTLKWEQARALFLPLIDTVKGMNDAGIIHGGISEETIIVGRDGKLRLADYSIKKLRMTTSELETRIYPGFAAIEQYDVIGLHVDNYTDVYGLSAVLFRVFIGSVPPEALTRLQSDVMTIPSKFAEELPRHVLSALANGLQVLPKDRTQDIEDFKNELVYGEVAEAPSAGKTNDDNAAADAHSGGKKGKEKAKGSSAKYAVISSLCTALVFIVVALILWTTVLKDIVSNNSKPDDSSSKAASAFETPEVDKIGDIDSDAVETAKTYSVGKYTGKYYSDVLEDENNEPFKFVITGKEFSSDYPRGTICSQSVSAGTDAVRDTEIGLVISLGPEEIKIANLIGMDETTARMELLKQGFLDYNIHIEEKYDEDRQPGTVIEQYPEYGQSVSADDIVKIIINSYEGSDGTDSDFATGSQAEQ